MSKANSYNAIVNDQTFKAQLTEQEIVINESPVKGTLEATGLGTYSLLLDGVSYDMHIHSEKIGSYTITINGTTIEVDIKNQRELLLQKFGMNSSKSSLEQEVRAPMPGLVLDILVSEGQEVEKGAGLLILEAMKMENEIKAPAQGVVKKIHVQAGSAITKNDLLIEF